MVWPGTFPCGGEKGSFEKGVCARQPGPGAQSPEPRGPWPYLNQPLFRERDWILSGVHTQELGQGCQLQELADCHHWLRSFGSCDGCDWRVPWGNRTNCELPECPRRDDLSSQLSRPCLLSFCEGVHSVPPMLASMKALCLRGRGVGTEARTLWQMFRAVGVCIYFWPRDLSSPTRNRTHAPCRGSSESKPLDRQGSCGRLYLMSWDSAGAFCLTPVTWPSVMASFGALLLRDQS